MKPLLFLCLLTCHSRFLDLLIGFVLLGLAFLPILRMWDLKLTNLAVLQTHWHSGAPPGVTGSGPVFETVIV